MNKIIENTENQKKKEANKKSGKSPKNIQKINIDRTKIRNKKKKD